MKRSEVVDVLNHLLGTVYRSLPVYLTAAPLWVRPGSEAVLGALDAIAADHRVLAERIAGAIAERGGRPETRQFPLEFTSLHDVSTDFIVRCVLEHARRDVAEIECCIERLREAPLAQSLARDALKAFREHAATLEGLMNHQP